MGGRRSFALAAPGNAKPLFLPTYVHDFNPIGRPFAKLKTLLGKAGGRAFEDSWRRSGGWLDAFSPQDCAQFFIDAAYASP